MGGTSGFLRYQRQAAIQIGKGAEKYNIFAYEEPTTPTPKITKLVAENVKIPIASGERIYTRWGYAPYFENGSLALIQPDLGTCGGISEGKKICDMAYTYDVSVQTHVCASPLSTAPRLCIWKRLFPTFASMNIMLSIYLPSIKNSASMIINRSAVISGSRRFPAWAMNYPSTPWKQPIF
jgi:hypothetical protein